VGISTEDDPAEIVRLRQYMARPSAPTNATAPPTAMPTIPPVDSVLPLPLPPPLPLLLTATAHAVPVHPAGHVQLKEPTPDTHVPPFAQGLETHASIGAQSLYGLNPGGHRQVKLCPVVTHVPPLWHGVRPAAVIVSHVHVMLFAHDALHAVMERYGPALSGGPANIACRSAQHSDPAGDTVSKMVFTVVHGDAFGRSKPHKPVALVTVISRALWRLGSPRPVTLRRANKPAVSTAWSIVRVPTDCKALVKGTIECKELLEKTWS